MLSGCSPDSARDKSPDKLLLATDSLFARTSLEVGTAEAFNRFLAEDAILLPNGGVPVRGRQNIYANMNTDTVGTLSWAPQHAEVAESGELGYTWGTYEYSRPSSDGTPSVHYGKYLNVWKKNEAGEYKLLVDMGNNSPVRNN